MEMSEALPVADKANEFRGSAPLTVTEGKREAAGATVREKKSILSLLPESLPEDVKNAMIMEAVKSGSLGAREFMVFRRESWDNSFDTDIGWPEFDKAVKPKWAAYCTCGLCGATWHSGWKNQYAIVMAEGPDGMTYPGIPDPYDEGQREVDEGELVACPCCDQQVVAVSRASLKNGRTYQCMMGRVENLGQYTAVIYWMLKREVDRDARSEWSALPWAAVIVGLDGKIYRFVHTNPGMFGKKTFAEHWSEAPRCGEPINSRYYSWEARNKTMVGGYYVTDVPDQRGQSGEKTGLADYIRLGGEFPLAYLLRQRKRKSLENLVRAGWVYTIDSAIAEEIRANARQGCYLDTIADFTQARPHAMLRMTRREASAFGARRWNYQKAALWMRCEGLSPASFQDYISRYGVYETEKAVEAFGVETFQRIDAYLKRQETRGGDRANSDALGMYRDYRNMLRKTGGGETAVELYPPNLRRAHDRVMQAIEAEKNKEVDKKFASIREKWSALEWSDGTICAVLPRKSGDLTREGKVLHHCVGGYAHNHTTGSMIIFIRHARRPERSWFTLNIDVKGNKWVEVQLHGYGNEYAHGKTLHIPEEVRAFVDRWEKEVLTPVFRQVKHTEAEDKPKKRKARRAA